MSKDAWMMTLDFALTIKPDLSNYEDDCTCTLPLPHTHADLCHS